MKTIIQTSDWLLEQPTALSLAFVVECKWVVADENEICSPASFLCYLDFVWEFEKQSL